MAAPTYSQQFSIGLLGTVSNVLSQPMTFWRCTTCGAVVAEGQTGTVGRDLHTSWHAGLDSVASNASSAVTTANAAKTAADAASKTAGTAASDASAAKTTAGQAQTIANQAASDAGAAATAAGKSATDSASALTAARNASSAAGQALTAAQNAGTVAGQAMTAAQSALPGTDMTLCPLCRAAVMTNDLRIHLTYHYRRAHGDPVEFPSDFDPTTQDMAKVDPPMRVANQG